VVVIAAAMVAMTTLADVVAMLVVARIVNAIRE
jgi:hypothetical protein